MYIGNELAVSVPHGRIVAMHTAGYVRSKIVT